MAPRGIEKLRLSGRRCDELRSLLVYFPYLFVCGGGYKYYLRAPDDTGVVLNAGAKFDLALSGGSDAYLLARQWVGANPSLARRGRRYLSKTGAIIKINKSKSSPALTASPMLTSLRSHLLPGQELGPAPEEMLSGSSRPT